MFDKYILISKKMVIRNKGILIMTSIYILLFLLMLPLREVSFLDDFAYIQTVGNFINTGNLKISDWASTVLVFPVLWGTLFSKIFGFSIQTLHFSNIVLLYFGLIAFYQILKLLKITEFKAILLSLFLISYPWIFSYVFTFMSDTFYLSLMLISLFFYLKGLKSEQKLYYLLGGLFAGLSFITRQIGVTILIAIALILFIKFLSEKRIEWQILFYSLAPPLLIIFIYYWWVSLVGLPAAYIVYFQDYVKKGVLPHILPYNLQRIGDTNLFYLDLFLQRPAIYFISIVTHLLPIFLIFSIDLNSIKKRINENMKFILFGTITLLFYSFLVYITFNGKVFRVPEVFVFDRFIANWIILWPKLFFISLPFWIIAISLVIKDLCKKFIFRRPRPVFPSLILYVAFILIFSVSFINTAKANFPDYFRTVPYRTEPHLANPNIRAIYAFQQADVLIGTFKEIWFYLVVMNVVFILVYLFLIKFKIKIPQNINFPMLFITSLLIQHFLITIIFPYTHWEEYTIPWIPLILILFICIFKNSKLSTFRSILVVFLLILFSFQLARNKYQTEGVKWEIATKLIHSGIPPNRIGVGNGAWLMYWYWEDEFKKLVDEQYQGNKYLVERSKFGLASRKQPEGDFYNIVQISPDQNSYDNKPLILTSDSIWIFEGRKVVLKRFAVVKVK